MTMVLAPAAMVEPAVTVTVAFVPGRIDAGVMLPVNPLAAVAVKETLFFALPLSVTPSVNVVVLPASTVPLLFAGVSAKSMLGLVVPEPPFHSPASKVLSTEPRPVARLYGAPAAVKPVTPGTLLLPERVAWKGLLLAF